MSAEAAEVVPRKRRGRPGGAPENLTMAGIGRKVGTPNKVTADVRKAIALIAERNVERFESWLAEIDDPAKRCDVFLRMLEYHLPKLVRSELSGSLEIAPSEEAFLRLASALQKLERQEPLAIEAKVIEADPQPPQGVSSDRG